MSDTDSLRDRRMSVEQGSERWPNALTGAEAAAEIGAGRRTHHVLALAVDGRLVPAEQTDYPHDDWAGAETARLLEHHLEEMR